MDDLIHWDEAGEAARQADSGVLPSSRIDLRGVRTWGNYVSHLATLSATAALTCRYLPWLQAVPGFASECIAKVNGARVTRAMVHSHLAANAKSKATVTQATVHKAAATRKADAEVASKLQAVIEDTQRVHDLESEVATVESEVATVESEVATVESEVATVEAATQKAAAEVVSKLQAVTQETQRVHDLESEVATVEAATQKAAAEVVSKLQAVTEETQRVHDLESEVATVEAATQKAAAEVVSKLRAATEETQRVHDLKSEVATVEAATQKAAAEVVSKLRAATEETQRIHDLKSEVATEVAATLQAATEETQRVTALQSKVATLEAANREAAVLARAALKAATLEDAAARARQNPPLWLALGGADPSNHGPTDACRFTAKQAPGSNTFWHLEGRDSNRVAVIMPVAGARDWTVLLPGQKSTVDFFVTTTVLARDKTFYPRSTVSCVGRGLFRFSNANTRFNREIPKPLVPLAALNSVSPKGVELWLQISDDSTSD
jgi:type I site-specific restriction endonuclease